MSPVTRFFALPPAQFVFACLLAPAAVGLASWSAQAVAPRPTYQVICHPDAPVAAVDRHFLQDAFLKKVSTWPDGRALNPVDLTPGSPTRRQFSEMVLKRPVDAVRNYWQQHIFAGRDLPPPEVSSDADVVRFVLCHDGAVGYVSGETPPSGARVLTVR